MHINTDPKYMTKIDRSKLLFKKKRVFVKPLKLSGQNTHTE